MIKALLLVVLGIMAIIALRAMFIPASFRVERSITVKASPERIFPLLNDFQQFGLWSPWEKLDPAMTREISTPSAGPGAVYEWRGNAKAGAGRMEILESIPSQSVRVKLDFLKPFESHNTTDYTLTPAGDSTRVTWAMYGPSTFPSKVMQVFMSMDKMIGGDFDRGLAGIKAIAEQ